MKEATDIIEDWNRQAKELHENGVTKTEQIREIEETHSTEGGWCCACPTDIAKFDKILSEQRQSILEEVEGLREDVYAPDDYTRKGFNEALDTVISILSKSESELIKK